MVPLTHPKGLPGGCPNPHHRYIYPHPKWELSPNSWDRVSSSSHALGGEKRERVRVFGMGGGSLVPPSSSSGSTPAPSGSESTHLPSQVPSGPGFHSPRVLSPRNKTRSRLITGDPSRDTMAFPGPDGVGVTAPGHTDRQVLRSLDRRSRRGSRATDTESGSSQSLCVCAPVAGWGPKGTGGGAF